jgi:putative flippase GtrA
LNVSPKVVAGAAAGAITTIVVWAVQQFANITIPAEVATAISTVLSAIAGYAISHDSSA